jgi:hypothetical protein
MRENPTPNADASSQIYAGDNFVRYTGEFSKFVSVQRFAWEAGERGQAVNAIANPSQAELLHKEFSEKKETLQEKRREAILEVCVDCERDVLTNVFDVIEIWRSGTSRCRWTRGTIGGNRTLCRIRCRRSCHQRSREGRRAL